jgi:hypothetical protein
MVSTFHPELSSSKISEEISWQQQQQHSSIAALQHSRRVMASVLALAVAVA